MGKLWTCFSEEAPEVHQNHVLGQWLWVNHWHPTWLALANGGMGKKLCGPYPSGGLILVNFLVWVRNLVNFLIFGSLVWLVNLLSFQLLSLKGLALHETAEF